MTSCGDYLRKKWFLSSGSSQSDERDIHENKLLRYSSDGSIVVGWIMSHKDTSKPLHVIPGNANLFGSRVFADTVKLKVLRQDHPGFKVGPKSLTGVLIRESSGKCETQREGLWWQRQRWDLCSPKPRNAHVSSSHEKPEGVKEGFSLRASSGNQLCWNLDFGLWASRMWEHKLLLF